MFSNKFHKHEINLATLLNSTSSIMYQGHSQDLALDDMFYLDVFVFSCRENEEKFRFF